MFTNPVNEPAPGSGLGWKRACQEGVKALAKEKGVLGRDIPERIFTDEDQA